MMERKRERARANDRKQTDMGDGGADREQADRVER